MATPRAPWNPSSAASVLLLGPGPAGPMEPSSESSELLRNVALALQGLGFQVRVLGPTDGPLQELRKVGLEAAWKLMSHVLFICFGGWGEEDHRKQGY